MKLSQLLFVLLVFLGVLTIVLLVIGVKEVDGKPVPCVDGKNRVNLEGIMCKGKEVTFFGGSIYNILWLLGLMFILSIVGGVLSGKGY